MVWACWFTLYEDALLYVMTRLKEAAYTVLSFVDRLNRGAYSSCPKPDIPCMCAILWQRYSWFECGIMQFGRVVWFECGVMRLGRVLP